MNERTAAGLGALTVLAIAVACMVGYVLNIIKLATQFNDELTAEIILRIVGIFPFPPLGVFMGLFVS